jgi:hypothetical protein
MAEDSSTELESFQRFISEQLGNGGAHLSPEECLRLWRVEHPSPEELNDSVAAVKRGLEQAERGEGKSVDQFDGEFRERHGIGQDA